MPDRRASLSLIAGLTLASPSLVHAVAQRLMLCLPDTWAPATVVGICLGLLAFIGLAVWRLALRRLPVLTVQSMRTGILATHA